MRITFAADASSYQATVNWQAVRAAGYGAGTEKCTEGTGYANPFWPAARAALGAAASPSFTPGVYHYLTAGNGAAQADWFARQAGAIPGFVIWCDLERAASGTQPTVADARAFVARVRQHYPGKRVGLYASEGFTGNAKLTFTDMLWSPHYVAGSGAPARLYEEVPESWWNAYGGLGPVLLQFSQSAQVPGVSGLADVSAYRGTAKELHDALLGIKPAPKPTEDDMPAPFLLSGGAGSVTPVAFADKPAATKIRFFPGGQSGQEVSVAFNGHPVEAVKLGNSAVAVAIPQGALGCRVTRVDGGTEDVSAVVE